MRSIEVVKTRRYFFKEEIDRLIDYALSINPNINTSSRKKDRQTSYMRGCLIAECKRRGATNKYIADYLGCSASTVTLLIQRFGIYEEQFIIHNESSIYTFIKLLKNFEV